MKLNELRTGMVVLFRNSLYFFVMLKYMKDGGSDLLMQPDRRSRPVYVRLAEYSEDMLYEGDDSNMRRDWDIISVWASPNPCINFDIKKICWPQYLMYDRELNLHQITDLKVKQIIQDMCQKGEIGSRQNLPIYEQFNQIDNVLSAQIKIEELKEEG